MGFFGDLFGGSESQGANVWEDQAPYLNDLYGRSQMASYGGQGQNYANQFQQPAFGAFNQMAQGGAQNPALNQGLQNFGSMQNQALGGAIDSGLNQISNNFNRNIMPSINSGAAMTNTSGGSRQGIAQGLAAGEANRQAGDFVNRMQSENFQNQMSNQLGAYGMMGQNNAMQNQAMGAAMSQAPQLSNLGFGAQYGDLQNLQQLLGGPTVLGGSSSSSNGIFAPIQLGG